MIFLVNFATKEFRQAQKLNSFTGKYIGGFNKVFNYNENNLNVKFNPHNLRRKGFANYFWKSIIINKAIKVINITTKYERSLVKDRLFDGLYFVIS